MHVEDAAAFLADCMARPRPSNYPSFGYEVYLPNVIQAYLKEVERPAGHESTWLSRVQELSPLFYEAAWDLCRRGILRPGVQRLGGQSDGGGGDGYSVTTLGRTWIAQGAPAPLLIDASRLSELFATLSKRLGPAFLQRSIEGARCHAFGCYLASCAMCGAAAESILLTVAIVKTGDEDAVLKAYRGPSGRHKTIEQIVKGLPPSVAGPFRGATGLLSFWRDEAAHGRVSEISEIEAHEAVARLIRFAQFTNDRWEELTAR